jgi:hypothetical protein
MQYGGGFGDHIELINFWLYERKFFDEVKCKKKLVESGCIV